MDIRHIAVCLDVDEFTPSVLECATDLARRFDAKLTGVAAEQPAVAAVGTGFAGPVYGGDERDAIEDRLSTLEQEFRTVASAGKSRWLALLEPPNTTLISIAHTVDLFVVSAGLAAGHHRRHADAGDLILAAGRPVLIAARSASHIAAERIVVGWKNTREARRAVADALPFLVKAQSVVVASIDDGDTPELEPDLADVVEWAQWHGVNARREIVPSSGPAAHTLRTIAQGLGADLIVAGAYGHSRASERIFGGVTRDLLAATTISLVMSS